jgi:hypothetical protein
MRRVGQIQIWPEAMFYSGYPEKLKTYVRNKQRLAGEAEE